jgi:hypothetical protein
MKKSTAFLTGMTALLLSLGLILAACSTGGDDNNSNNNSSFDGSTLVGTTWVATKQNVSFDDEDDGPTMDITVTFEFTSNAAGAATFKAAKWNGNWPDEMKAFIQIMMAEENGPFTYTYNADTKAGTYILKSGDGGTFTVDADKQELTTTELDKGKTETTVFKLQSNNNSNNSNNNNSNNNNSNFDGSTLAGTKWVGEKTVSYWWNETMTANLKVTLEFISDTQVKVTSKVTRWGGDWSTEDMGKFEGMITEENDPYTSTYDATTRTGTYTMQVGPMELGSTINATFTVDVKMKTLTSTEVDEDDGETETTVFSLQ